MNRIKLGILILGWHSSINDPIYAVGSFYVDNKEYPDKTIVENALRNLLNELEEQKLMLEGKDVVYLIQRRWKSVKEFAGYTDSELTENINELKIVCEGIQSFLEDDYEN